MLCHSVAKCVLKWHACRAYTRDAVLHIQYCCKAATTNRAAGEWCGAPHKRACSISTAQATQVAWTAQDRQGVELAFCEHPQRVTLIPLLTRIVSSRKAEGPHTLTQRSSSALWLQEALQLMRGSARMPCEDSKAYSRKAKADCVTQRTAVLGSMICCSVRCKQYVI